MQTTKTIIFTCFIIFTLNLSANIKINEIFYDPAGSDSGYEWIELYNPTDQAVDISGWRIEKAGTSFSTAVTIEFATVQPYSFYLIGEEFITDADYICVLGLQNGGSSTDGVRLISVDGLYTDTVLYDEPNTNQLPDDSGNPGTQFAPDVSGGHSLARINDGYDTDNSATDCTDCEIPTPGTANIIPADLEIRELNWIEENGEYRLFTTIFNLSTVVVDNSSAELIFSLNDNYFANCSLPQIMPLDSIFFEQLFDLDFDSYASLSVEVTSMNDNNLENNTVHSAILVGESPIIINELYFKPFEHSREWIEIYNRSQCGYYVDKLQIEDISGSVLEVSTYIESEEYLIICQDSQLVACEYPELNESIIIQPETWVSLNNTEETIFLKDAYFNEFDIVSYDGSNCDEGYSWERINPWIHAEGNWNMCLTIPTPGSRNSIYTFLLPAQSQIELNPNPFSPYKGECCLINFAIPETLSTVTIRIFDLKGRLVRTILDQQTQACNNVFIWDGRDHRNKRLPIGIYVLLLEATGLESEKTYRKKDTVVIAM